MHWPESTLAKLKRYMLWSTIFVGLELDQLLALSQLSHQMTIIVNQVLGTLLHNFNLFVAIAMKCDFNSLFDLLCS